MEKLILDSKTVSALNAGFASAFGAQPQRYFSAPGRTEIGGNHTDHQRGRVLAAAVNLEAAAAVRDWAFRNTSYDCLYSYMTSGNTASYVTAASIGMTRTKDFSDDVYGSMYVYTITKEEWQQMVR